jgi:hypothetical protein
LHDWKGSHGVEERQTHRARASYKGRNGKVERQAWDSMSILVSDVLSHVSYQVRLRTEDTNSVREEILEIGGERNS